MKRMKLVVVLLYAKNHINKGWKRESMRMIFLFQNSWTIFKVIFTNTLNTPTGPGGKIYDLRIFVWFLSQAQSYRW